MKSGGNVREMSSLIRSRLDSRSALSAVTTTTLLENIMSCVKHLQILFHIFCSFICITTVLWYSTGEKQARLVFVSLRGHAHVSCWRLTSAKTVWVLWWGPDVKGRMCLCSKSNFMKNQLHWDTTKNEALRLIKQHFIEYTAGRRSRNQKQELACD